MQSNKAFLISRLQWRYTIDRKSHDQCVNLYLYFLFFSPRSSLYLLWFLYTGYTKVNHNRYNVLRRSRKVWHIWDEISFLFSHSILFSLRRPMFFVSPNSFFPFVVYFCWQTKRKQQKEKRGPVVTQGLTHLLWALCVLYSPVTSDQVDTFYCNLFHM